MSTPIFGSLSSCITPRSSSAVPCAFRFSPWPAYDSPQSNIKPAPLSFAVVSRFFSEVSRTRDLPSGDVLAPLVRPAERVGSTATRYAAGGHIWECAERKGPRHTAGTRLKYACDRLVLVQAELCRLGEGLRSNMVKLWSRGREQIRP